MSASGQREVEHEITVAAAAETIYALIAEVAHWPEIFPPTVHVDYVDGGEPGDTSERIRIWATANGEAKSWTSRRTLDPANLRIDFRQEVSSPPVRAMGGAWVIEPLGASLSRVRLLHDYQAIDDDPDKLAWIDAAVDRNSRAELAAMKANIETADNGELMLHIKDTVRINGAAKDVYDFINEASRWQERLPHVARVELTESTPGLQVLEMDTSAQDGSTHTTKSIRVCFPHDRIVYKQIGLPALMSLHTGRWDFVEDDEGVAATSSHTVVVNAANIADVLGPDSGVAQAKALIQTSLSKNSTTTLRHAKQYAEGRR